MSVRVRVDGYYQAVQRYKQEARLDEEVSVKLMLESDPSDNLVIADTGKKGLVYVSESDTLHMISRLHDRRRQVFGVGCRI